MHDLTPWLAGTNVLLVIWLMVLTYQNNLLKGAALCNHQTTLGLIGVVYHVYTKHTCDDPKCPEEIEKFKQQFPMELLQAALIHAAGMRPAESDPNENADHLDRCGDPECPCVKSHPNEKSDHLEAPNK